MHEWVLCTSQKSLCTNGFCANIANAGADQRTQCSPMWGVVASITIASTILAVGEYYIRNRGSTLTKGNKEPVKLLESDTLRQKAANLARQVSKKTRK